MNETSTLQSDAEAKPALKFALREDPWSSVELFSQVSHAALIMSDADREEMLDSMWTFVQSEYDSRHLSQFFRKSGLPLSEEFWAFDRAWGRDENNHYLGARWLISAMYGLNQEDVERRVASTPPDFSHVEHLLRDEFSICVALTYDELASARGYAETVDWAKTLGPPQIAKFFRKLARDEMYHHINAREIIACHHRDRVAEIPDVLDRIIDFDTSPGHAYRGTFLFDHTPGAGNPFDKEYLLKCAHYVCSYFKVGKQGS